MGGASALTVAVRRSLQLFSDAKPPNDEFVDFEPANSSPSNCQSPNSDGPDGQCSSRERGKHQRTNRLCTDCLGSNANRWGVGDLSIVSGLIPARDLWSVVTQFHAGTYLSWVRLPRMVTRSRRFHVE